MSNIILMLSNPPTDSARYNQVNLQGGFMRYLTATIISLLLVFTSPILTGSGLVHAHGMGHSHEPLTQAEAEEKATKVVAKLVQRDKLDGSWSSVAVHLSEQKEFGDKVEWVITFKNENVSDPKKQTLYVFLTLEGRYLAANFTGN